MTILTKLRDRMARRTTATATETAAVTTDHLSALTGDLEQALQVRWWHWRHLFLEAKKLQLEEQTHES